MPILCRFFLNTANEEYARNQNFTTGALRLLEQYPWPGNIRQLENLVKRAVLLCVDNQISEELIQQILEDEVAVNSPGAEQYNPAVTELNSNFNLPSAESYQHPGPADGLRPYLRVREDESAQILQALAQQQGNKTRAAMSLGMTPRQFRYRIKKLNLEV